MDVQLGGLVCAAAVPLRWLRRVDLGGEIHVAQGQSVEAETVIGVNSSEELLHHLRVETDESRPLAKLLKSAGDHVRRGEPVAYYMYLFGLGYREYVSPVNGTVVSFDVGSGLIVIREHPEPVRAGLPATVAGIIPAYGVVLEANGTLVEATAGWGGCGWGQLLLAVPDAGTLLDAAALGPACRGKVVVVGAHADAKLLQAAYRHGASALIVGGVDQLAADEFAAFAAQMTYEEYQTRYYSAPDKQSGGETVPGGSERVEMPILALEGFGAIPIRPEAWELLSSLSGTHVFVDASCGSAVGGGEAPVLLAAGPGARGVDGPAPGAGEWTGLVAGVPVRIVGGSHGGLTGRLVETGVEMTLETGHRAAGCRVELTSGTVTVVPFTNLETLKTAR